MKAGKVCYGIMLTLLLGSCKFNCSVGGDKTAKTKHRHSDDIDRPAFRKNLTSKTITSINKRLKNMLACEVIEGGIAKEAFKVYVKGKDLISRLDLKCVSSKEVVDVSKGTENVST